VLRVNTKNTDCRSIEDRPQKINNRVEYGHWEGDTVKGPKKAKTSLFYVDGKKDQRAGHYKRSKGPRKRPLGQL